MEAPLYEGRSILVGCGAHGRETGEARLLPEQPGRTDQGVPSEQDAPRLRLVSFRLHPMRDSLPEDRELAAMVRSLLDQVGPPPSQALARTSE